MDKRLIRFDHLLKIVLQLAGVLFVLAGINTTRALMAGLPLSNIFMGDFSIYARAMRDVAAGINPYAIKGIGIAFLYPPASLFLINLITLFPTQQIQGIVFDSLNIILLGWIAFCLTQLGNLNRSKAPLLFLIMLFFAPTLELLLLGQINLVTLAGIITGIVYAEKKPWLAGFALCIAAVTKITPLIFLLYLLVNRNFKTLAWTCGWIILTGVAAGLVYGFDLYGYFATQFIHLLGDVGNDFNNQALLVKLKMFNLIAPEAIPQWRIGLTVYFAIIATLGTAAAWISREKAHFFLLLLAVMTLYPTTMWYHHYVFLLPVYLLLASLHPKQYILLIWTALVLLVAQVDRFRFTTGFLIQIFSQVTMLGLLVYLIRAAVLAWRNAPSRQKVWFPGLRKDASS